MKLRRVSATPVENDARARKYLSQERVIATLRLRIKTVEEKNRDLMEQLEIAYGKLSTGQGAKNTARRLHANDVQGSMNKLGHILCLSQHIFLRDGFVWLEPMLALPV